MLLGISQPTFMPWIGYFAFLDKIDNLVFLDNVQFEKRSWQQRNNIRLNNQKHFLTLPVKSKGKFSQKISEVEILQDKSLVEMQKKIFHAYKKAKYFEKYYEKISNILNKKHNYLSALNVELIQFFTNSLDIDIKFDYSSNYCLDFKKEQLIFEICKLKNCDEYLTTVGSKNYLDGYRTIPHTSIKISFFEYKDVEYNQLNKNFIPKLSILDLLFNEGTNSINIIRKGIRIA